MNRDEVDGHATPRWVAETQPQQPTAAERALLSEVLATVRRVRHGSVQLVIQDGRVIQIDTLEKKRL